MGGKIFIFSLTLLSLLAHTPLSFLPGSTMNVGAVADLRGVKSAARAARLVLERTTHSLLAGDQATAFALEMGLTASNLTTSKSAAMWEQWKKGKCQPNFRVDVVPDPTTSCGPYHTPTLGSSSSALTPARPPHSPQDVAVQGGPGSHDTIAMVVIDANGEVASGTSTNGANRKVPGRVGDAAVAGAGVYGESGVGGCGATGDGDQMMRFLPTYLGVELMRTGSSPKEAAEAAIARVRTKYPTFWGAVFCVSAVTGEHGGASNVGTPFSYTVVSDATKGEALIVTVRNATA